MGFSLQKEKPRLLRSMVSGLSPGETAWWRKAVVDQDGMTVEMMEREEGRGECGTEWLIHPDTDAIQMLRDCCGT